MDETKVFEMLVALTQRVAEIQGDIKAIKHDLEHDYKVLHGNGHAGLIARVEALEKAEIARNTLWHTVREWIGWIFAVANLVCGWWLGRRGLR